MVRISKKILVTGGAGYIGSHMVRLLISEGRTPVVFDNLSTGHRSFIPAGVPFFKGDLKCVKAIDRAFKKFKIDAVMHFAASIVVPESVANPVKYYENNTVASLNLAKVMVSRGIHKLIISSTAAVYGDVKKIPVLETDVPVPVNPYGASKLIEEQIMRDIVKISPLRFIALRYFNVAGSHPSADIGIRGDNVTHLVPSILKVATGERKVFRAFGDDYPTPDGTCIRDFIYVGDLCQAHLKALDALDRGMSSDVFNLGSEDGYSVKQVYNACCRVLGMKIALEMSPRRPGDPAKIVASAAKARKILKWKPVTSLDEIIRTAWQWELHEMARKRSRRAR